MSDDLVSGLLTAIEREEKYANARHETFCKLWPEAPADYSACDCLQRSVLRLCRAHRNIIDLHQPRGGYRKPDDWYGDQNECRTCGGYELEAGLGARGHRSKWPCETLLAVAEGYGLREENSDGQ